VTPGTVLVASAPRGWSWAVIEDISDRFVYLCRISAREAAEHKPLVTPLPAQLRNQHLP
jgi:hypothetical protein